MSNQAVEKVDKGKLKKWKKRVENGEIQDGQLYNIACGTFGLMGRPSLIFNSTISTTEIDVKYIREFIYKTLLQDFVNMRPKAIEVKNRGYIRNVVVALVCGCCSPSTVSNGGDATTRKVRISRRNTQLQCLCDKVLTFPIDEFRDEELEQLEKRTVLESDQGEDELLRRLLRCKMSTGQLSLWGYPIPRPLPDITPINEEGGGEEPSRPMKKPRLENFEQQNGIERDVIPHTIAEKLLQLHRSSFPLISSTSDHSDTSLSGNNFISAYRPPLGYFETLSIQNLSTFQSMLDKQWSRPMKIASLDCEMLDVRDIHASSGIRREVVRITVLDAHKCTVLEAIVHPVEATIVRKDNGSEDCDLSCVVDFKESFTGISQNTLRTLMLTGQTISQQQMIATLLTMFSADTVLVGHGLENDLRCMGIAHGRVVDTAALFPHPRGFPYRMSLKQLAKKHLNMHIQKSHVYGHCSAEDSAAAWQLACHAANQRATGIFMSGNVANTGGDVTLPMMEERVSLIKRLQTQVQSYKEGKADAFGPVLTWLCDVEGCESSAPSLPTVVNKSDSDVLSIEDEDGEDMDDEEAFKDLSDKKENEAITATAIDSIAIARSPIVYGGRQHMIFANLAQQYDCDVTDANDNNEDMVDYHRSSTITEGCEKLTTFLSNNNFKSVDEKLSQEQQMRFAVLHVPSPRNASCATLNESYEIEKIQEKLISTIQHTTLNSTDNIANSNTLLLFLHQPDTTEALALAHQRYLALHGVHAQEVTQVRHGHLTGVGDTLRQLRSEAVTWDASQEQEYHLLLQRLHSDVHVSMQII